MMAKKKKAKPAASVPKTEAGMLKLLRSVLDATPGLRAHLKEKRGEVVVTPAEGCTGSDFAVTARKL
jgi:hypothetical protein